MVFRMVEEQNIIKQRQIGNATITEKIVDDENDDQPITAEISQEDIQEEKPPSLMWRVGSGLWGASSVRSKNKHFFVYLFVYSVSSKRYGGPGIRSCYNCSWRRCWSNQSCWIICCWSCLQCWWCCNWCRIKDSRCHHSR